MKLRVGLFAVVLSFPFALNVNAQTPPDPAAANGEAPVQAPAEAKPAVKGKPPAELKASAAPSKPLPPCSNYIATPLDSNLLEINKKLYFTSVKMPSDAGAASAYLIEADLEAGKAKRIAGFKAGKSVSLISHGKDASAITILDFTNGKADCGEGTTTGTALKPSEQKVIPSFPSANYGLVASDTNLLLADLDKGTLAEKDLSSNQSRSLESFPRGTRPLFLKTSPPVVLYNYFPETNELGRFIANKKVASEKLKLRPQARLIREKDKFAIAIANGQILQIGYFKGWSGDENKVVDLTLPAGFQSATVAINGRFESDEILVFGKDDPTRRSLKSVLHFTGKDLKTYKTLDANSYFSSANFLKDGSVALMVSELSSGVVEEIWTIAGGAEPRRIDVLKEKKPGSSLKKK